MQQKQKRTAVAQRAEHVSRWQQSGMSKQDYCKAEGVNYQTFISWFKKRRYSGNGRMVHPDERSFIPLQVMPSRDVSPAFATVSFANGSSLQLHSRVSASFISQLLRSCK